MKENKQGVQFSSNIRKFGGSYYVLVKPELKDYLNLSDGSNVKIQTEASEHGRYLSLWNPSQQDDNK